MAAKSLEDNKNSDFIAESLRQWSIDSKAWEEIYKEARIDQRFISATGQWDTGVKNERDAENLPALVFNECYGFVQQTVNAIRKERPQIKVVPGDDDANTKTADMWEDNLRHIQYECRADSAYDTAVECAAGCSIGFFRIPMVYDSDDPKDGQVCLQQHPSVQRILDPLTVVFDGGVQEADFSDAKRCWVRVKIPRGDFKKKWKAEPAPWDSSGVSDTASGSNSDWGDTEDEVWYAEKWEVETSDHRLVQLRDGRVGLTDDPGFTDWKESDIVNERSLTSRDVVQYIIDGEKILETHEWVGNWIPIIPVLGSEMIVDGKRILISMTRFSRDSQKLLNAYGSAIAEACGTVNRSEYIGYDGQFQGEQWTDQRKRRLFRAVKKIEINGQVAPLPRREQFEPEIQALTQAWMQMQDQIRREVGYADSIPNPSQQNLYGVAIERRQDNQQLTNFHFTDNLLRSQWHAGRVILDLRIKSVDTPRALQGRTENGNHKTHPVTRMMPGLTEPPTVTGFEGKEHHRSDVGKYLPIVTSGPTYDTKLQEQTAMLTQVLQQDPNLFQIYAAVLFRFMGYPELEEVAIATAPPAVQQILKPGTGQAPTPQEVQQGQQLQALQQRNQQLVALVQSLLTKVRTKEVEVQGRLALEHLQTTGKLMILEAEQRHDAAKTLLGEHTDAIEHMVNTLHQGAQLEAEAQAPAVAPTVTQPNVNGPTQ